MNLRVGILQCDEVREELRGEFGDYPEMFVRELARLRPNWEFPVFRVFADKLPEPDSCDAYITTGSTFGVNDDEDWIRRFEDFVGSLAEGQRPYVGICFGHQMLAKALGGRVSPTAAGWGVGIHRTHLRKDDSIELPPDSKLLVSHQDQVVESPPEVAVLGGSEFCPVAWIRFGDHMLGIQGHPEFRKEYARALMDLRRDLIGEAAYKKGVESLREDPDTKLTFGLIVRFIESAAGQKKTKAHQIPLWRRLLGLVGCSVGTILGLLLAGAIEAGRGTWQLSRLLSEGRQSGEVFEIADLMPPIPTRDQNAATLMLALTNKLLEADDLLRGGPPLWQFDDRRRLQSLDSMVTWERRRSLVSDGPDSNTWAAFELEFNSLEPLAEELQSAVERPAFQSGFDYHRGFKETGLMPLMMERARIADLLAFSFVRHLRLGAGDTAKARLLALVRWGGMQKGDRLILSEMIRYRSLENAVRAIRHGLGELTWTDVELAKIQEQLEDWDLVGNITQAYELERAMNLDFLHAAAHDQKVRKQQLKLWQQIHDNVGAGFSPTPDFWLKRVQLPLWSAIWWRQETVRSLRQWNLMIDALRDMEGNSLRDTKDKWLGLPHTHRDLFLDRDELKGLDRWRFVFVTGFSFMERIPDRVLKLETERRLLLTALALARYQLRREDVPETLSELIPGFLSKHPMDAMDGNPMRFRRTGPSAFLLYSVGEDYVDDNGDRRPIHEGRDYTDIWDGRDVCWPISATRQDKGTAR